VCSDCGSKFTDDRWKASIAVDWGRGDSRPHLCDDCKARALEAERQAEQAERGRQEQEAQASNAGGWLGRWRS
jgi:DNA-directed RNA polymerase subunit RPC12/RpoP